MTNYAIRVTFPREHQVIQELRSLSEGKFALGEEMGSNNLHCHLWLTTTKSEQTIRNRILQHVPKGNKSYSLTTVKDETKYLAYILKESILPELRGFTEEEQKKAIDYKEEIQLKQKKKSTIINDLREEMKTLTYDPTLTQQANIMNMILTYHVKNNLIIRKFQTMSYFYTLYSEQSIYNIKALSTNWTSIL